MRLVLYANANGFVNRQMPTSHLQSNETKVYHAFDVTLSVYSCRTGVPKLRVRFPPWPGKFFSLPSGDTHSE